MKVIIAGTRTCNDMAALEAAIAKWGRHITEVVSGGANGADRLGEQWAHAHGVKVKLFPANWRELGKAAGPIRNGEMGKYADGLIALWDGQSKGTKHMISVMRGLGKVYYVHYVDQPALKI